MMIERHLTQLRARHRLAPEEEKAVRALVAETRHVEARAIVIREGVRLHHSTLLLDGVMCRYKDLRSGQRQITELHMPGDFADMHSFTLKRLDHNVLALTGCTVGIVPHERIRAMTEAHPRLTRIYWFNTNLDAAIHREWELSLGKRDAVQRIAHLLCELQARLSLVGLADESGYALRLTQVDAAECLGLTSVHVNRMLRQLRERGLASFKGGRVDLFDLPALRRLADFDPGYLYMGPAEL